MSLADLVKKYPRNPELVRRIWTIQNYMVDWHDFNSITDQGYLRGVESIGLQLPTLISKCIPRVQRLSDRPSHQTIKREADFEILFGGAVTTNPRGDKSTWCKIIHSLLDVGKLPDICYIGDILPFVVVMGF